MIVKSELSYKHESMLEFYTANTILYIFNKQGGYCSGRLNH